MTQTNFDFQLAQSLYNTNDQFPIDFDDAWQWLDYSKKQNAKETLLNNFEEDLDFLRKGVKSATGGRPSEWLVMTIDCFKSMAMMAGTPKGKEVRKYFLECEKIAKDKLAQTVTKEIDSVELVRKYALVLDTIFSGVTIEPSLIAGLKLNTAQKYLPEVSKELEPARQLLINSTAKEPILMTVTQLGKLMSPPLKASDLNNLLIQKGYQTKNTNKKSQKDLTYLPTDKAKDHCSITLASGTNNNTTYQQLRWYNTIINLI